jgi:hypothetical protein
MERAGCLRIRSGHDRSLENDIHDAFEIAAPMGELAPLKKQPVPQLNGLSSDEGTQVLLKVARVR